MHILGLIKFVVHKNIYSFLFQCGPMLYISMSFGKGCLDFQSRTKKHKLVRGSCKEYSYHVTILSHIRYGF